FGFPGCEICSACHSTDQRLPEHLQHCYGPAMERAIVRKWHWSATAAGDGHHSFYGQASIPPWSTCSNHREGHNNRWSRNTERAGAGADWTKWVDPNVEPVYG